VNHIKDNMEREEVIEVVSRLVKFVLLNEIVNIKLKDLAANIELKKELSNIVNLLKTDDKVIAELAVIIDDVLVTIEKNPQFYDDTLLRKDIAGFFMEMESTEGWKVLEPFAVDTLNECFKRLNACLKSETKNALINEYIINAAINSLVKLFAEIIRIINVEAVVVREVNNMDPANIEKLFYKFAGTYFNKITIYGWIGVFGGLISYVISFILSKLIK